MISRLPYVLLCCPLAFAGCAAKVKPAFFTGVNAIRPAGTGLELPRLADLGAGNLRVQA
jgi:hypothetical protein